MGRKPIIKIVLVLACLAVPKFSKATPAPGPLVSLFNDQYQLIESFYAYDKTAPFGVNAVAADIDNDGKIEIITAPQSNGEPQIKVFTLAGQLLFPGWLAFSEDFRGGVNLATGDVNGDNIPELIAAQASAGQAWLKIYSLKNNKPKLLANFLAYSETFQGGAFVTTGDLNNDGKAEIITGAGVGGGPQVRVFDQAGHWTGQTLFPFPADYHGGVTVAVGDINNDTNNELIVGQATKAQAWLKIYGAQLKKVLATFKAYPDTMFGGVNVSILEKKHQADKIITAPGSNSGANVRVFYQTGKMIGSFFGYDESFHGKTTVSFIPKINNFIVTVAPSPKRYITGPKIALTFDDGYSSPQGSFNRILATLKAHNLQVTFFMLGDWIEKHPSEFQQLINDGHEIGNHSYNHPAFTSLTATQMRNEITAAELLMNRFGVNPWPNFRYPYGSHNVFTDQVVTSLGYRYWPWTASTGDTGQNRNNIQAVTNGALYNLHDGGVILAHCSSNATAAALDNIINVIEHSGYTIVKVSEL